MYLLFSITGLKWEALGETFFLYFFFLWQSYHFNAACYLCMKDGKRENDSMKHCGPGLEQQKLKKFSSRSRVAGCCMQARRRRRKTQSCSQGLLCCWHVSVCTFGAQVWWPHFSPVWCTSDVGQSQKNWGERPGAFTAMASASLLLWPGQAMASLRAEPEAFPAPWTRGLCSMKHGEGVALHGGEKWMKMFAQLLWEYGRTRSAYSIGRFGVREWDRQGRDVPGRCQEQLRGGGTSWGYGWEGWKGSSWCSYVSGDVSSALLLDG